MAKKEKIITMYARGFLNQNIYEEMQELYGVKVSPDMVKAITDKIINFLYIDIFLIITTVIIWNTKIK